MNDPGTHSCASGRLDPVLNAPPFLYPALLASSWGGGSLYTSPPNSAQGLLRPTPASNVFLFANHTLTTPAMGSNQLKTLLEKLSFDFLEIWTSCWNLVHCPPGTATGFLQLLTWRVCVSCWSEPCACQDYFQVDSKGGLAGDHGPGCLKWSLKTSLSPFPGIH